MARGKRIQRAHGFIGRIFKTLSDDIGFIRPSSVERMDGGDIGLDIDDDIFVHINSFDMMLARGFNKPERLEVGMWVVFYIGPSKNKEGRVTAECSTVYYDNRR